MKKIAVFAFQGELMCFAHALLNVIDLKSKGYEVKLIIEGSATALIEQLGKEGTPFAPLYAKVRAEGLLAGICRACAGKMGSLAEAERQGIPCLGEMQGHPGFATWLAEGYEIISM
ncbi:MAG: hypothetical protein ACD_39C00933G0004 [uncultured bacterium]|nr:MAG: hypothetical protein ACD_39C00933G0004 [uncultured bacterium]